MLIEMFVHMSLLTDTHRSSYDWDSTGSSTVISKLESRLKSCSCPCPVG